MQSSYKKLTPLVIAEETDTSNVLFMKEFFDMASMILFGSDIVTGDYTIQVTADRDGLTGWVDLARDGTALEPPADGTAEMYPELVHVGAIRIHAAAALGTDEESTWDVAGQWTG